MAVHETEFSFTDESGRVTEKAEQQIEDTRLMGKHLNYGNMSYGAVNCDTDPFTFIFRNY